MTDDLDLGALDLDLGFLDGAEAEMQQTERKIRAAALRRERKAEVRDGFKRKRVQQLLREMPQRGYSYHLISDGGFDAWSVAQAVIGWAGKVDDLHVTSWTISQRIARAGAGT